MTVRKITRAAPKPQGDPAEILGPHAGRQISAFLKAPRGAEDAFWTLVYGRTVVPHDVAKAVVRELEASTILVGQLIVSGWRPLALQKLQRSVK